MCCLRVVRRLFFNCGKECAELSEIIPRGLDGRERGSENVIRRKPVDAQTSDRRTIGAESTAAAAVLVVDDMAVVEDEVALLCRVAASVDHVDARSAVEEQDLREIRMLVQAARHVG